MDFKFSHDTFCIREAYRNRRADGGQPLSRSSKLKAQSSKLKANT